MEIPAGVCNRLLALPVNLPAAPERAGTPCLKQEKADYSGGLSNRLLGEKDTACATMWHKLFVLSTILIIYFDYLFLCILMIFAS
jgi:hypothetical protein